MNPLSQREKTTLNFLGIFLLAMVALNMLYHWKIWYEWQEILWYCNVAGIVCGSAILLQSQKLISAVLLTAIPAQSLWIIDFFLDLSGHGMGRSQNMFEGSGTAIFMISTILHGSLIPVSLYATSKLGYSKRAFFYGLTIFILILLPLTFLEGDFSENRNCVFYPCDLDFDEDTITIARHVRYMTSSYLLLNVMGFWVAFATASHSILRVLFNRTGRLTP